MNDYMVKAIQSLKVDSEFTFTNDDYSTIEWIVLEGEAPTKKEIEDEIARLQAEDEAQKTQIITLKESARQKLISGQPMTAEEAALLVF